MNPLRTLAVLLAFALTASLAAPALAGTRAQQSDIVQSARDAGRFKTLTTLLKRAGLVGTLREAGPYTVFAPTDTSACAAARSTSPSRA